MRYHVEILKDIETYFAHNNLIPELKELQHESGTSATGSELCMRISHWLKNYRKQQEFINPDLNTLITEFLAYCRANEVQSR